MVNAVNYMSGYNATQYVCLVLCAASWSALDFKNIYMKQVFESIYFVFGCVRLTYLPHFTHLVPADATIVPSVRWWLGLTSSLTPARAHTNTWKSSMSVSLTVSTLLV